MAKTFTQQDNLNNAAGIIGNQANLGAINIGGANAGVVNVGAVVGNNNVQLNINNPDNFNIGEITLAPQATIKFKLVDDFYQTIHNPTENSISLGGDNSNDLEFGFEFLDN